MFIIVLKGLLDVSYMTGKLFLNVPAILSVRARCNVYCLVPTRCLYVPVNKINDCLRRHAGLHHQINSSVLYLNYLFNVLHFCFISRRALRIRIFAIISIL